MVSRDSWKAEKLGGESGVALTFGVKCFSGFVKVIKITTSDRLEHFDLFIIN